MDGVRVVDDISRVSVYRNIFVYDYINETISIMSRLHNASQVPMTQTDKDHEPWPYPGGALTMTMTP